MQIQFDKSSSLLGATAAATGAGRLVVCDPRTARDCCLAVRVGGVGPCFASGDIKLMMCLFLGVSNGFAKPAGLTITLGLDTDSEAD